MMRVEVREGRLAEVRFRAPFGPDELPAFTLTVRNLVKSATAPVVFITDWRRVPGFSPDDMDALVWTMRRDNPNIAANAILVDAGSPMNEQAARIVKEAVNPSRRVFTTADAVQAFLAPMLEESERERLRAFLAEKA